MFILILSLLEVINPLHPNISIHIPYTGLYTFLKVLTRRICLTIKSFYWLVMISLILLTLMYDLGVILLGEIRC